MDTLLVTFLLLVIVITLLLTAINIWKRSDLSKRAKLNLYLLVILFPLLGSALYFSFFKPKINKSLYNKNIISSTKK
ncbi:MAG: hypothetical protein JWP88_2373 [Flaviaesturariibacter sp.]|nr:hypothetical protein [Flaviaesturariibacter sp.]